MTEYQLLDPVASASDQMADMFSLFLTVISAYLLISYFIGERLSRIQAILLTGLFLFASAGQALDIRMDGVQIAALLEKKAAISPLTPYESNYVVNTNTWVGAMVIGICVAVYFLWQVRHPKKE